MDRKRGIAGPATGLQLAAYVLLIEENFKIPRYKIKRYALQNIKNRPKMVPFNDRNDFNVFLGLVSAFHHGCNLGVFKIA